MKTVKRLWIRNVMGIEDLEIAPGKLTIIEGDNAQGKTSVLEAARALFGGGHDATLIRQGQKRGEIVALLSDESEATKTIKPSGSDLKIRHPDLGMIPAAQTWLNGIIDQKLGLNPIDFLHSKNRAELLLEAVDLELTSEELRAALAGAFDLAPDDKLEEEATVRSGEHALTAISRVRKVVYDERTGVNRIAKEKATSVQELRRSLPDGGGAPITQEAVDAAQRAAKDAEVELAKATGEVDSERHEKLSVIEGKFLAIVDEAKATRDRAIEAARLAFEEAQAEAMRDRAKQGEAARQDAESAKENLLLAARPEINRANAELATMRERLQHQEREENTRRMLRAAEIARDNGERESAELTAAIEGLDRLKLDLMKRVPIAGLEIEDGEVHLNGIPWARINEAERIKLAVRVATLRKGDLPFLPIDGLEALTPDNFELFCKELLEIPDIQPIVTRATPGPLKITTREA